MFVACVRILMLLQFVLKVICELLESVRACLRTHTHIDTDGQTHGHIEQMVFSVVSVKAALLFHFDNFMKIDWIFEYGILYKG
jgi:hypothetical protein